MTLDKSRAAYAARRSVAELAGYRLGRSFRHFGHNAPVAAPHRERATNTDHPRLHRRDRATASATYATSTTHHPGHQHRHSPSIADCPGPLPARCRRWSSRRTRTGADGRCARHAQQIVRSSGPPGRGPCAGCDARDQPRGPGSVRSRSGREVVFTDAEADPHRLAPCIVCMRLHEVPARRLTPMPPPLATARSTAQFWYWRASSDAAAALARTGGHAGRSRPLVRGRGRHPDRVGRTSTPRAEEFDIAGRDPRAMWLWSVRAQPAAARYLREAL